MKGTGVTMKKQWILLLFCFCLFVFPCTAGAGQIREASEQSDLEYVFVHGLSGWGSYDARYQVNEA